MINNGVTIGLIRKTEKYLYKILNVNDVTNTKQFWKIAKIIFSNKVNKDERIN